MSLAARQRYDRHPSWQASAAKIREFIEEASTRFSGKPAQVTLAA
jgi:hypothetical protein